MAQPDMARPGPPEFFFALKRQFGPTDPVFRAGWAVKIVARKNRANFGSARFWPGPLLARPSLARPARLPPLIGISQMICQTQIVRPQPNSIKPKPMRINIWKCPKTFMDFLNLLKLLSKNIETLSQKQNIEETFSISQDMAKDVDN